jgi:VanZ family protein
MEKKDEDDDPWLGADKFYHIIMCFSITLLFYSLSSLTSNPFLRRHAISIASIISLLVGAAKEVADHLGFFRSSGASFRDAIADIIGVFIASFALSLFRSKTYRSRSSYPQGISLV